MNAALTTFHRTASRFIIVGALFILAFAVAGSANSTSFAQEGGEKATKPPEPTDLWVVQLAAGADGVAFAASNNYEYLGTVAKFTDRFLVRIPGTAQNEKTAIVQTTYSTLNSMPNVVMIEHLHYFELATTDSPPTDPYYASQWHLHSSANHVYAEAAWANNYTGAGVHVGVVDDGLQHDHTDLDGKYISTRSYDYGAGDSDPYPAFGTDCINGTNCHGTAVAGVIAAEANNGKCGVGAGYDATLSGQRLIIGVPLSDATIANAMRQANGPTDSTPVDISSNSWGPVCSYSYSTTIRSALQAGAETDGTIYVFASGNYHDPSSAGHCTADLNLFATSRHTITVGASNDSAVKSSYSNEGSSVFVNAPSNDSGHLGIYTTDITGSQGYGGTADNDCTSAFGGTSSATPLVSGVIAMIQDARTDNSQPFLGWRDVQHVLANSSDVIDSGDIDGSNPENGWQVNGAGFWTSPKYGFGRINADAATTLAATWTPVGPYLTESWPRNPADQHINTGTCAFGSVPTDSCYGNTVSDTVTVSSSTITSLEHVEVKVVTNHTYGGDLRVRVTSPSGTISRMAEASVVSSGAPFQATSNHPLMSVQFWGEDPNGTWTIQIDDGISGDDGDFQSWELILYGTSGEPEIVVEGPGPVNIADGGSYNMGTTTVGTPIVQTITVSNTGTGVLNLLTNPPSYPAGFTAGSFGSTSIDPSNSTTFQLTCNATAAGTPSGTVLFNNNDGDETPFNFTVNCTVNLPVVPADTNVVSNGDFAAGEADWNIWGTMTHSVVGGVLNLTNTDVGGIWQDMGYTAPSATPFELNVDLGNTSAAAKDVQVMVHDGAFTDVLFCAFTVPAGQPLDTFTVRGATAMAWPDIRVEVIPQTFDGQPALEVDNVDLQYKPGLSVSGTECVAAPYLPENTNLVINGDFPTDDAGWTFWGSVTHSVASGVLNLTNTNPGGMFQDMTYPVPSSAPFELTVDLGNTSAASKDVQVIVHDGAFTDVLFCAFTVPAGQAIDTFTVRGATAMAWSNIRVEIKSQTFDGLPALEVDNVDLQYKPGLSVSGTECVAVLPDNTNLVTNGDFPTGDSGWTFWGSVTHSVATGVLNLTNTNPGGMFQDMAYAVPSSAPFELNVDLGNTSAAAKDVQVMVHDGAFTDVLFCAFTVPAGQAIDTFTVRGATAMAWSNIRVEVIPQTFDGQPALEVDNVDLQYKPSLSVSGTECVAVLPDNTNLVTNGDFPTDDSGWTFWGSITHSVASGVLNLTNTNPGGMFQDMAYAVPSSAPFELTADLGNTSAASKDVQLIVHDGAFTDVLFCAFTVSPGQPLGTFTVRGATAMAWSNIRVEVIPQTFDGLPALEVDNVNLQYQPGLSVSGTECVAAPYLPENTNLVQNGDFPTDTSEWLVWGSTSPVVSSGVLNLTNTGFGGIFQDMEHPVPTAAPFELTVDLGNTSAASKDVQVIVHDGAFTDVLFCAFTIPISQPLDTFTVRGATAMAWSNIRVEIIPQTFDGLPALQVDNVNLQYQPGLSVSGTECIAAPPTLPESANLVSNGDFSQDELDWEFWGPITHGVTAEVLELANGAASGAYQDLGLTVPTGAPLQLTVSLGNTHAVAKDVQVILHNPDWTDVFLCPFTIPASQPLATFTVQGIASVPWTDMRVEVMPVTYDSAPALQVDNVNVQYLPGLSISGTVCTAPPSVPDGDQVAERIVVEAESSQIAASADWTSYATEFASGGMYIYSSGSGQDTVNVAFSGTALDIVYVQHPALGSFDVIVDGTTVATVNTNGAQAFGQRVSITGLADSVHQAQIVPSEGATVALDAFEVAALAGDPVVQPEPTAEPTDEPIAEPTAEPTEEPTAEPVDEPEAPINPSLQIVESNAAGVQRTGNWSTFATEQASGGSYLYSSGSGQDAISLTIAGTQFDVIYIQHPALGSFNVVVDGAVVAQVNSRGEQAFGQRVSITGLLAGEHVVQIVTANGQIIAIDAFAVEALVIVEPAPEPTEEPAVVPTEEPTPEPTEEPAVVPTEEPTPEPTEEPVPVTPVSGYSN